MIDLLALLEELRWQGLVRCPYCQSCRITTVVSDQRYHCNECFTSFSALVGSPFQNSRLSLTVWAAAIRAYIESSGTVSARGLAGTLQINKDTACRLINRIAAGMSEPDQR